MKLENFLEIYMMKKVRIVLMKVIVISAQTSLVNRVIVHKVEGESRSSDSDSDDRGRALPRPSRSSLYCFHIWRK